MQPYELTIQFQADGPNADRLARRALAAFAKLARVRHSLDLGWRMRLDSNTGVAVSPAVTCMSNNQIREPMYHLIGKGNATTSSAATTATAAEVKRPRKRAPGRKGI